MKMNYKGKMVTLSSRGTERVSLYGEEHRKTVWQIPDEWKFFTRVNGQFIEVYHIACSFSDIPSKEGRQ